MDLVKTPFLSILSMYLFLGSLAARTIGTTSIKASETFHGSRESDRVVNLPGQPSIPSISHFSGYITVNKEEGRALFYWFFEAQSQPSNKPLLLWLNGGPGCSSIGFGAALEIGPLRVGKDGTTLHFNNHSWNQEANVLFLESPAGVGFSYTNTSSNLNNIDDSFVAEDAYSFLVNWMERFPQYKSHDFFISGESYAGHYVPQLSELVYDRNKDKTKYPFINLKGFIVGNAETNDYYDYRALLEFAWSHVIISEQLYQKAKKECNFRVFNWSNKCNEAISTVFDMYSEIDLYNVYAPACIASNTNSSSLLATTDQSLSKGNNDGVIRRAKMRGGGYDPCYARYLGDYFNRASVQISLHAKLRGNPNKNWTMCNDIVFNTYNFSVFSVLPIYTKLIKGGLKIWMYSGDIDGRVPALGSRYCAEALGLPLISPWRSWFHNHQVAGRVIEYRGFTYVTVRGAGHLVPLDMPTQALSLIHSFLSDQPLPIHR